MNTKTADTDQQTPVLHTWPDQYSRSLTDFIVYYIQTWKAHIFIIIIMIIILIQEYFFGQHNCDIVQQEACTAA